MQSPVALSAYKANRERLMSLLGVGFPAFRPKRDDSEDEALRVAGAIMAIVMLEQLALREIEIADPGIDKAMVQCLANEIARLDRTYPE